MVQILLKPYQWLEQKRNGIENIFLTVLLYVE